MTTTETAATVQALFDRLGLGLRVEVPPDLPQRWIAVTNAAGQTVYVQDHYLQRVEAKARDGDTHWLNWGRIWDDSCHDARIIWDRCRFVAVIAAVIFDANGNATKKVFGIELNSGDRVYCWQYRGDHDVYRPGRVRYETLLAAIEAAMNAPDQEDGR